MIDRTARGQRLDTALSAAHGARLQPGRAVAAFRSGRVPSSVRGLPDRFGSGGLLVATAVSGRGRRTGATCSRIRVPSMIGSGPGRMPGAAVFQPWVAAMPGAGLRGAVAGGLGAADGYVLGPRGPSRSSVWPPSSAACAHVDATLPIGPGRRIAARPSRQSHRRARWHRKYNAAARVRNLLMARRILSYRGSAGIRSSPSTPTGLQAYPAGRDTAPGRARWSASGHLRPVGLG